MNEKERYKEYYSKIKLDDKTSQRIRNDMHSAKRRKNNSLSVHTFNRYASLASCFLVMVLALNSIAGRTYTLPVYHVETIQETSAQETETEIETSDETTEYQYSTEVGDIITTTVPDELPLEKITVVPDIDDEDEVTDGENDGITTEPYQESSQTKTGDGSGLCPLETGGCRSRLYRRDLRNTGNLLKHLQHRLEQRELAPCPRQILSRARGKADLLAWQLRRGERVPLWR